MQLSMPHRWQSVLEEQLQDFFAMIGYHSFIHSFALTDSFVLAKILCLRVVPTGGNQVELARKAAPN